MSFIIMTAIPLRVRFLRRTHVRCCHPVGYLELLALHDFCKFAPVSEEH